MASLYDNFLSTHSIWINKKWEINEKSNGGRWRINVQNVMSAVLVICQQMKNFSQEMPTTMKEVNKFHCDAAVKRKLNKKSSIAEWKGGWGKEENYVASENDKRKPGVGNFVFGILELFQLLGWSKTMEKGG